MDNGKASSRGWLGPAAIVLVAATTCMGVACSDPESEEQTQELELARDELAAGHAEQALFHAKSAWDPLAPDPDVALVAAAASLQLKLPAEAIHYAEAALDLDVELEPRLHSDLSWARGLAYARRYLELKREDDWREANRSLEEGTVDGTHRIESAAYLALIQVQAPHDNVARARRYADIVLTEAPASKEADTMRKLLARLDADQ